MKNVNRADFKKLHKMELGREILIFDLQESIGNFSELRLVNENYRLGLKP